MKISRVAQFWILAAFWAAGCASHRSHVPYHAGDEVPPPFLTGPVSAALTNLHGFSATVKETLSSANGLKQEKSGELLGREGALLFQPALGIKSKRAQTEGGLFYVWDENRHAGYVMSEALQGYAPLQVEGPHPTALALANEEITEEVAGHPCHRCQGIVSLDDGTKARLTLWQADDLNHFPVRIQALAGMDQMTLDFSEIRQQSPAKELFAPPDGFTPYATSVALMNELIVRDSTLAKKYPEASFDEPADVRRPNGQQPLGGLH
jgi:hypothetical protein